MSFADLTFTILEDQSVSEEIDFGSNILVSLMFDGWKASAGIYLETRQHTGASWSVLYRPDGQYMLSGVEPSAGMAVGLSSDLMRGKRIIRLRSGVPGALVNQDATRTVTFARQSLLIATRGGGGSAVWPSAVDNLTVNEELQVGEGNDTGTISIGSGLRLVGYSTAVGTPSTAQVPLAGDAVIHYDSNGGKWYFAFNTGSGVVVVELVALGA